MSDLLCPICGQRTSETTGHICWVHRPAPTGINLTTESVIINDASFTKALQGRIAELEAELEGSKEKVWYGVMRENVRLKAENARLREALNAIAHDADDNEVVRVAVNALLGGGE